MLFAFSRLTNTALWEPRAFSLFLTARERVLCECVGEKLWSYSHSWNGKIPNWSGKKLCILTKLTSQLSTEPATRRSRKTWSVCNISEWKFRLHIPTAFWNIHWKRRNFFQFSSFRKENPSLEKARKRNFSFTLVDLSKAKNKILSRFWSTNGEKKIF